ncbi:MAG: UDP-N-acetyl-D-mannosamine dehydrogenase [Marinobacter sp.]|nr:UDP-N-acetyl-D-mannosamine dehydrogenase [Marinobacter sp.]
MSFENIVVVGLGYIGLPTAAVFASRKKRVLGVDINADAVNLINQGEVHIVEPDLDMLVHAAVSEGYLRASTEPEPADAFLIAVPTPFKTGVAGHEPDLAYIQAACDSIAPVLQKGNLVVLESTSPVGATEQMAGWLAKARPDLSFPQNSGEDSDIRIAHCPERVLPGHILRELVHNDRVIGGMTPRCSEAAVLLYQAFVEGECILTNARTAEMCKLTENSFRDTNIAFANELSIICDKQNIDVWELIRLANRHPRVNILQPGPGVGGHCIAVDPWFIVSGNPDEARLIRAAREVNDKKPDWVCSKVNELAGELINGGQTTREAVSIACLGLSFKADIDDLRESPALKIAEMIAELHPGKVIAVEPHIEALPSQLTDRGVRLTNLDEALQANIVVLLVDHKEWKSLSVSFGIHQRLLDTRGVIAQS